MFYLVSGKTKSVMAKLLKEEKIFGMNNKAIIEFGFRRIFMKNSADLRGCYPPRPSASVDNTLLYLQNSSYPTRPHSIIIIAKYLMFSICIQF